jgi:hypothetical protein
MAGSVGLYLMGRYPNGLKVKMSARILHQAAMLKSVPDIVLFLLPKQ